MEKETPQDSHFLSTHEDSDYRRWGAAPRTSSPPMDPLSITASVLTLMTAVAATCQGIDTLREVRNAPAQVTEVLNEVTDLRLVLAVAEDAIYSFCPPGADWPKGEKLIPLLLRASDTLAQLSIAKDKLCKAVPQKSAFEGDVTDSKSFLVVDENADLEGNGKEQNVRISRRAWLKEKKTVERLLHRLRETRQNLSTALSALTAARMNAMSTMTLTIQASVPELEMSLINQVAQSSFDDNKSLTDGSSTLVGDGDLGLDMTSVIETSYSTAKCQDICPCQCHAVKRIGTPTWLKSVIGTLFYSYSGTPLMGRAPCNYIPCQQSGAVGTRFNYHFPTWIVKRAVSVSLTRHNLCGIGGSWTISIPKTLSDGDPVWRCINYGTVPQLAALLAQGLVNACDMNQDGKSLLHFAVQYERPEISEYLLRQGVNKYFEDGSGVSAAMLAWEKALPISSVESTKALTIRKLRHVFYDQDLFEDLGFSPLHLCILNLDESLFEQHLTLNFPSLNAQDSFGRTPLFWAVVLAKPTIVDLLLSWNADVSVVDKHRRTALHWAAVTKAYDTARSLLAHGASPHAQDEFGRTPLHEAAKISGNEAFVHLLIDVGGAEVDCRDYIYLRTPLHLAAYYGKVDNARALIDRGADMNFQIPVGRTPLLNAVAYNQWATTSMLVEEGARVDAVDRAGMTVLLLAARYGSARVIRALTVADLGGVDPDAVDDMGRTARQNFTLHRREFYFGGDGDESELEVEAAFWELLAKVETDWRRATGKEGKVLVEE
ncbi:ankyrin repeat-containing domain protein [Podospora conica]|nr:ankyrin repeat-containing domain protein [Schizothecium conicum]